MRSPPRPQVSLGTEQSGGRQSGSPGEVLPSTVPACEPCSQPRVLQPSGDNAASPAHQGPSEHPTQPHDFRSSTQADFHPWRQQRQPGRAGRGPSALAKHSAREGLTVPPAAAPREVPVPCSGGTWSLSMLQAQRQGRSCASARFRGTQDAALHPRHETPREHALPSLLGQGQGKKNPENKDKNAASFSWKHSYTQRARPSVLRAPEAHGEALLIQGWARSSTRKGHGEVAAQSHRVTHQGITLPISRGSFWGKEEVLVVSRQQKGDPRAGRAAPAPTSRSEAPSSSTPWMGHPVPITALQQRVGARAPSCRQQRKKKQTQKQMGRKRNFPLPFH